MNIQWNEEGLRRYELLSVGLPNWKIEAEIKPTITLLCRIPDEPWGKLALRIWSPKIIVLDDVMPKNYENRS